MIGSIRRVAIGLSGGVDSTVSALILKRKGRDFSTVFNLAKFNSGAGF